MNTRGYMECYVDCNEATIVATSNGYSDGVDLHALNPQTTPIASGEIVTPACFTRCI